MARTVMLVLLVLGAFGYPVTYVGLRVARVFVHTAFFVSEEGLNAHLMHDVETRNARLARAFSPLVDVERWVWRTTSL